ncbi:TM2 domain-containing protein [Phenylobacterium sp.]|uniref:TM2 domain-containing protein n=1 Tax=Phenylobacterium sp. TaxID=1871053 RepID=UPI0025F814AA|nr:TM2 domain-containing protein [Phenylobacterium sp.]
MNDKPNNQGISADTQALMAFESGKKSTGVAYLLWIFLGGVGAHRFYLGRTGSGIAMLALTILGWALLLAAGFGLLFLVPLGIWLLVDLFTIPGMVRSHNTMLAAKLTGGGSPLIVAASH